MRCLTIVMGLVCLSYLAGCSDPKQQPPAIQTPSRSGQTFESQDIAHFDARPAIDGSGAKVVFISGRSGVMRTYKVDATETTPTPVLLTDEASDQESAAHLATAISADGAWVAMTAVRNNALALLLKPWAGASETAPIVVDAAIFADRESPTVMAFSTDSRFLAYTKIDAGQRSIWVAAVPTDTAAQSVEVKQTKTGASLEFSLAWMDGGGGSQKLVTLCRTDPGSYALCTRTLTQLADAESAEVQQGATAFDLHSLSWATWNDGEVLLDQRISPSGSVKTESGFPQVSRPVAVQTGDSSSSAVGFDELRADRVSAFGKGLAVVTAWTREVCTSDQKEVFGNVMVLLRGSHQTFEVEKIYPAHVRADDTWRKAENPCEDIMTEGDPSADLDRTVTEASVNPAGVADDFRLVYTSRGAGDLEVFYFKKDASGETLMNLSQNKP